MKEKQRLKLIVARVNRGMDQKTLAERAGTTQPRISQIESGESEPKLSMAFRIARALGSTVDELFGDAE
jgi:DNA-binding XRE family transcriptional regulator